MKIPQSTIKLLTGRLVKILLNREVSTMKFNTQNAKIEAIDRVRTLCKRKIQKSRNETRHFYFPGFYTLLFQNYGITDNTESITAFRYNIMRSLFYCLNRRSQKKSYNWVEFLNMLDNSYPLVRPRIYVNIYE